VNKKGQGAGNWAHKRISRREDIGDGGATIHARTDQLDGRGKDPCEMGKG